MAVQKNFFHDYFDGQIIKSETEKYKMFKLLLVSVVSFFALFCAHAGFCNYAILIMVVCGMIWNFYLKLDSKLSLILCVLVSSIYFVFACNYKFYSNALVYIGFYIPFQMFALSKTYYGGSFVQIKKKLNDQNQIIFIILLILLTVAFYMFDLGIGGMFAILDATSAGCLVASAILRNERYNDYYYYRSIALILSIILWVLGAIEYQCFELIVIASLYLAYLVFDVGTNVMQKNTYENEYMVICKEFEKQEKELAVKEKLKVYKKSK